MSIKLMTLIWDNTNLELDGIEKAILLKMADFAADNGTQIFPSYQLLSDKTGFCLRTVKSQIKNLISRNIILLVKQGSYHTHTANQYRINVEMLTEYQERKTVYNPVDKHVDEYGASAGDALGASAGDALGASAGDAPHPSLTSIINKHHHVKGQQDDSLREEVFNKLKQMRVVKSHAEKWMSILGPEILNHAISVMFKDAKDNKKTISNPGAYLRKMLKPKLAAQEGGYSPT